MNLRMGRRVRFGGSDGYDGLPTNLTARGVKSTHLNTMKQASFKSDLQGFQTKLQELSFQPLSTVCLQDFCTVSVTSMVKANAQMCAFEVRAHTQFSERPCLLIIRYWICLEQNGTFEHKTGRTTILRNRTWHTQQGPGSPCMDWLLK